MAGALERQDLLVLRFDAEMAEYLLVVGLHALARDHDADAADGQQRRPADRGLAAPYAGASAGEAPVSQPRDTERARKGPDTGRSRPAAEFDGDFRPFAGRMGGIRGCGIRHAIGSTRLNPRH